MADSRGSLKDSKTIKGLAELDKKLGRLDAAVGSRILRSAVNVALTPVVKDARLRIPVGDRTHRTYDGGLVYPGFARDNIVKVAEISKKGKNAGRARGRVGVRRRAFYAVQFLELDKEKFPGKQWLGEAYLAKRDEMEKRFEANLAKKLKKATR